MLYSMQEYLKREKTEKLTAFVKDYYAGLLKEDFSHIIPLVEEELRLRKKESTGTQEKT